MTVSFDGLRKSLSQSYNSFVNQLKYDEHLEDLNSKQKQILDEMRGFIGALNCCYDDSEKGDSNDLSEEIELIEIFDEDDEETRFFYGN